MRPRRLAFEHWLAVMPSIEGGAAVDSVKLVFRERRIHARRTLHRSREFLHWIAVESVEFRRIVASERRGGPTLTVGELVLSFCIHRGDD
jgi:hypothetical protein